MVPSLPIDDEFHIYSGISVGDNMEIMSDLTDGQSGEIQFLSASPFEIPHILHKMSEAPIHPVFGHLILPKSSGEDADKPVACVVACHGSKGWSDHHHDHIQNWVDAGMAVFRVHCFESRQVAEIVDNQMMVTHAMMLTDAFQALQLLQTHPLIDGSRIAITGWSLGGTVALYAAWSPIAEALAPSGERFAAHLPFYPAAHMRPEEQRWSPAPIQILHGTDDDWTPLQFATELAELIRPHGANIEVQIYKDSQHSFDSKMPLEWLPDAIRLDHRTVQIDANGDLWAEKEPGDVIRLNEPAERFAAFQYAQNIGCHAGGNPQAREHALRFSTDFLLNTL